MNLLHAIGTFFTFGGVSFSAGGRSSDSSGDEAFLKELLRRPRDDSGSFAAVASEIARYKALKASLGC